MNAGMIPYSPRLLCPTLLLFIVQYHAVASNKQISNQYEYRDRVSYKLRTKLYGINRKTFHCLTPSTSPSSCYVSPISIRFCISIQSTSVINTNVVVKITPATVPLDFLTEATIYCKLSSPLSTRRISWTRYRASNVGQG